MVDIRRVKANDTQSIRSFINEIMSGEFPKESEIYAYDDLDNITEHYGGNRDIFIVAEKDCRIIGTVAIKEDGSDSALLRRIFVHKNFRGKGYGTMLLSKAMEFCFKHNYKNVAFRGTDKMQTALKLCQRNGFKQDNVAELGDIKLIILSKKLSD